MKKISSYILFLVLSFNSASSANELKEFEIAGFSLGESLLDYFDKSDIKNELKSE